MDQGIRINRLVFSMARADVRIRVRPSVIRVHVNEPGIRTVIRIPAPTAHYPHPPTTHLK